MYILFTFRNVMYLDFAMFNNNLFILSHLFKVRHLLKIVNCHCVYVIVKSKVFKVFDKVVS